MKFNNIYLFICGNSTFTHQHFLSVVLLQVCMYFSYLWLLKRMQCFLFGDLEHPTSSAFKYEAYGPLI